MFSCKRYLAALMVLMVLCGTVGAVNRRSSKVKFLPVAFFMACDASTPKIDKSTYPGSPSAAPGVRQSECVDKRTKVAGIKPSGISVYHDESIDKFGLVIDLKKDDARALHKMTATIQAQGKGKRILIVAGNWVVASGFLFTPFEGASFHISASSHDKAHELAWLFVNSAK